MWRFIQSPSQMELSENGGIPQTYQENLQSSFIYRITPKIPQESFMLWDFPWIFHGFSIFSMDFPWIFHGFSMDFPCSTGLKPTWMVSVLCFTNSAMVRSVRAEATEPAMVDTTCRSRSEAKRSEWFGIGAKCHEMPGKWCPIVR